MKGSILKEQKEMGRREGERGKQGRLGIVGASGLDLCFKRIVLLSVENRLQNRQGQKSQ
jgi:hypothetical protein